ncbi:MAG: dihydroorotate dehydrogenase electron transfer subunit [Spirochaetota bacterium]
MASRGVYTERITGVQKIGDDYRVITFNDAPLARTVKPGMFFTAACGGGTVLRRPFAFMDVSGDEIRALYRIVGTGTENLARLSVGDTLSIVAPLGTPFPLPTKDRRTILVTGGVGTPPMYLLAKHLSPRHEVHVFIGASTRSHLLFAEQFRKITPHVFCATDDGSYGEKGTVVDLLRKKFSLPLMSALVYACGPKPMLRALADFLAVNKLTGYFSLEALMGCGYGVCLGCAVTTKDGYKLCCSDGPVFKADEVIF